MWTPWTYKEAPEKDNYVPQLVLQNQYLEPYDFIGTGQVPRYQINGAPGKFNDYGVVVTGLAGNPVGAVIAAPLTGNTTG